MLRRHVRYLCIYTACVNPTLKCSNTIDICNGIMFDFYPGLPQFSRLIKSGEKIIHHHIQARVKKQIRRVLVRDTE